ncbi:MAG: hypothetical protein ACW981_02615 [Candidatus Hodarchaeales archaeon]|jgi:arginine decarboxylase
MDWKIEHSEKVYGLNREDLKYLEIDNKGDLTLKIDDHSLSIQKLIQQLGDQLQNIDHRVPSFTLRIPYLITKQINKLYSSFESSIKSFQYSGKFHAFYPIKVNPMKYVLQTVLKHDEYGFEAGTKSEFIVILKILREHKNRQIMCNGVKDKEYFLLIKESLEAGYDILVSIESLSELKMALDLIPVDQLKLLLRMKSYAKTKGHWKDSTGRSSKFGISVHELFKIVEYLDQSDAKQCLIGLHAHPGSQVNYSLVKYLEYLVDLYNWIYNQGFDKLSLLDIGGGLPINYTGRLSNAFFQEYADNIIEVVSTKLDPRIKIKPTIIVESGRGVTATHVLVIIDSLDLRSIYPQLDRSPENSSSKLENFKEIIEQKIEAFVKRKFQEIENTNDENEFLEVLTVVRQSWDEWKILEVDSPDKIEKMHDIYEYEYLTSKFRDFLRKELQNIISYGFKRLNDASVINKFKIFLQDISEIWESDYYAIGNFSVFNSVADSVLVDQYFPVMPISCLNQQPETIMRLVDLTCDSDGEISRYIVNTKSLDINKHEELLFSKDNIPLYGLFQDMEIKGFPVGKIKNDYFLIPLVGAYQDIIEFDHNLIGDLPDVFLDLADDKFHFEWKNRGQTIKDVVKNVGFNIENKKSPFMKKKRKRKK